MSDFLARLVERAWGSIPVLRPALPLPFAPSPTLAEIETQAVEEPEPETVLDHAGPEEETSPAKRRVRFPSLAGNAPPPRASSPIAPQAHRRDPHVEAPAVSPHRPSRRPARPLIPSEPATKSGPASSPPAIPEKRLEQVDTAADVIAGEPGSLRVPVSRSARTGGVPTLDEVSSARRPTRSKGEGIPPKTVRPWLSTPLGRQRLQAAVGEALEARGIVPRPREDGEPFALDSVREEAPVFAGETPGGEPTIHVTIGRVEVNTAAPSQPPKRTARKLAAPQLTLGEYLHRRREGRR